MTRSNKSVKDKEAKEKPNTGNALDYMNAARNVGYLWEFIDYFEKKLDKEIAPYQEQYEFIKLLTAS